MEANYEHYFFVKFYLCLINTDFYVTCTENPIYIGLVASLLLLSVDVGCNLRPNSIIHNESCYHLGRW